MDIKFWNNLYDLKSLYVKESGGQIVNSYITDYDEYTKWCQMNNLAPMSEKQRSEYLTSQNVTFVTA